MPRLFCALTLPPETRMWLSSLRGGLRSARWIDPENYHVTLRFIGDVDERVADEVAYDLSRVHRGPVPVEIAGLDTFGGRKPHSVFARVAPSAALIDLQGTLERRLQRLGLPAESRRFTPHVTIARLRGTSTREVADWLSLRGGFSAPLFTAATFSLLSSRASVGGGPYVTEHTYELAAAEALV